MPTLENQWLCQMTLFLFPGL